MTITSENYCVLCGDMLSDTLEKDTGVCNQCANVGLPIEHGDNIFTELATKFTNDMNLDDPLAQMNVVKEERDELSEAVDRLESEIGRQVLGTFYGVPNVETNIAEELADVIITAFVLADILEEPLDMDIRREYIQKMRHNLQKSGEKDESGKVIDDVDD